MVISEFDGVYSFLDLKDDTSVTFAGRVYPNAYVALIAATTDENELRALLADSDADLARNLFNTVIIENKIDPEEYLSRQIQILTDKFSRVQDKLSMYIEDSFDIDYGEFIDPSGVLSRITKIIAAQGCEYQCIMNYLMES
jgi:hypothetical protein